MINVQTIEIDNEKLKSFREANKLTLQQVADKVGVKRATVSNYEQGHGLPSANVLLRICSLYGIEASKLLKNN